MACASAHGAHPLNTEDTGTQGKGRWQLEVNGETNRDEGVRGAQAAGVLSYGVAETIDLQAGVTWLDTGTAQGAGDSLAAVKWRFWEKDPLSFAVRLGSTLPTAKDEKGLGTGRTTWNALLIGTYEGERWIFLAHAGHRRNRNNFGEREPLGEVSAAVLYKATENLKLLVDAARISNPDPASRTPQRFVIAGFIWQPRKDIDLDAGLRRGNEATTDRAAMAGITLRW